MDQKIADAIESLDNLDQATFSHNGMRRFRQHVEVPLTKLLGLHVPTSGTDTENVYVTWVADSGNIDNRLWQTQNKLLKGMDPRIAVGLCTEAIVNEHMWLTSVRNLSRIAPYLSEHNFEGILIVSTADDKKTFRPRRLLLLRGCQLAEQLAAAIPEISPEWYTVPLATRRPHTAKETGEGAWCREMLDAHLNVMLEGVSGIGKSYVFGSMTDSFGRDRTELATFHPGSNYEDFIESLRPAEGGGFAVVDGRFYEFCKRAAADPDHSYLFIIDEINRAPTASVLGDLLFSIDPSKRVNAATARTIFAHNDDSQPLTTEVDADTPPVRLQLLRYGTKEGPGGETLKTEYRALFCVPENVYILATRNTSDHSLGTMDVALERRFVPRRLEPGSSKELLEKLKRFDERFVSLESEVEAWGALNDVLASVSPDACLGYSGFFDAASASARIGKADDVQALSVILWHDYLLRLLVKVLGTFDAGHLLPFLERATTGSMSHTGGFWVEQKGEGLDMVFVVVQRGPGVTAGLDKSGWDGPPELTTEVPPAAWASEDTVDLAEPDTEYIRTLDVDGV